MKRSDVTVEIDAPPQVVWDYTTDLARTPEWRTTIRTIDPPAELAVGAPFAGTTRLLGKTWRWQLEITELDPPRRFAYVVTHGVAAPTVEYVIEPTDSGTRFTMSGYIEEMSLVARLIQPAALRALRRESRRHLDQLAVILDGASAPPA